MNILNNDNKEFSEVEEKDVECKTSEMQFNDNFLSEKNNNINMINNNNKDINNKLLINNNVISNNQQLNDTK